MTQQVPRRPIADKEILSFGEATEYLGVTRDTLLEVIRAGKIPAGKLFARWRLKKADIDFYIRHGKNPLVAEAEEKEKAEHIKRNVHAADKPFVSEELQRPLTTALLLQYAVDTLSTNPCYLVGPVSQSLLDMRVTDNGSTWDVLAKGSLAEVLSRAAELFLSAEIPRVSYRRQEFTLPATLKSLEEVKKKLAAAIAAVEFTPDDGFKLQLCADEVVTTAVQAGGQDLRVIIETGQTDALLTVISHGRREGVAGRLPGPESQPGHGLELTTKLMDDFLRLATPAQVIATIRKVKTAERTEEAPRPSSRKRR